MSLIAFTKHHLPGDPGEARDEGINRTDVISRSAVPKVPIVPGPRG